ncbi:MAG: FKBP-type peptidyl-prolyl cis-trans isomerase [Nanoarchaeota archaeon]|nr:FKBP-type peptidyl-prolyl cis-trans isomerase [Nanoarchaeota archaeon]MBU4123963.1 FKBP-type peptidyl-prolyl cis-trans isomerase [Nanoarchaeota archaeon]
MKVSDFVRIKYIGKIKDDGRIIDENSDMPLVVGEKWVMSALDDAILNMEVGDKKNVEITPDMAFGERNEKMIRTVPLTEFRKHNQKPVPGMVVNADNHLGKVLSVSGGRVKVDFNHPLSGKTLLFEVELKEKIEKNEEKVKAIMEWFMKPQNPADKEIFQKIEIKVKGKDVEIHVPALTNLNSLYKKKISEDVIKFLGVEKITFLEVFEKIKIDEKKIEELNSQLPVKSIEEDNN